MSRAENIAFERTTDDGLTDKERAVLTLADDGIDRADIAERTGLKPHRVANITRLYADSGRDAWKESAAIGSAMLGEAINRVLARRQRQTGAAR
ncbi:MAG: hypothetical protein A2792_00260 [Sphingomonadales bacterium RIFCSPHIGHO2_01_FULL_65_20]|nr:MAG: hypothetical protein A2792_00260 [Sphingomonadales bacterium RIFCSPHIGHO2_01_FULL_65_20]